MTTRGVTATLRVPGHPGWVAAGDDALWLALTDTRTTVRDRPLAASRPCLGRRSSSGSSSADRATYLAHVGRRLLASVEHIGSSGSGPSLIVALDWRTAASSRADSSPTLVGPLAQSGKDLWALQARPAALLRLDPLTLAPKAAPLRLSQGQALGLAAGGGYVWATEPDAGDVLRIDPATRIRQPRPCRRLPGRSRGRGGERLVRRPRPRRGPPARPENASAGREADSRRRQARVARARPASTSSSATRRGEPRPGSTCARGRSSGRPIRVAPPAKGAPALAVAGVGNSVWVEQLRIEHADPRVQRRPRRTRGVIAHHRRSPPRRWRLHGGRGRGLGDERRRPRRSCGSTRPGTPSSHASMLLPARQPPPARAPSGSPTRRKTLSRASIRRRTR